jgi:hypothetical protein
VAKVAVKPAENVAEAEVVKETVEEENAGAEKERGTANEDS